MNVKTIPVGEARNCTNNWQNTYKTAAKAFLIPINDLIDSLKEMNVITRNTDGSIIINDIGNAGVRIYMAMDSSKKVAKGEKVFIVATKKDSQGIHRDIITDEKNTIPTAMEGTGIFDFSQPCPNTCDTDSPLY